MNQSDKRSSEFSRRRISRTLFIVLLSTASWPQFAVGQLTARNRPAGPQFRHLARWTTPDVYAPPGVNIGDGVTDATRYVQQAFDSGLPVRCVAGETYLVSNAGISGPIDTVSLPYALKGPAGLYFDGSGCIIRAATASVAANVPVILVVGDDKTPTPNVTLVNVTLDQQGRSQPVGRQNWRAAVDFDNTPNLKISSLIVNNGFGFCARFFKMTAPTLTHLACNGALGTGFAFGAGDVGDFFLHRAAIRGVYTTKITGRTWPSILPGNPATFYVQDTRASEFTSVNDGGGWKVEGKSARNVFLKFLYIGGDNGTSNSGFKVQRDSTGSPADNTIIGLRVERAFGTGIYETGSRNSKFVGYTSIGDGAGDTPSPDVWVEGTDFRLHNWSITGFIGAGINPGIVYLRPNSVRPYIGRGRIISPACHNCYGILDESSTDGVVVDGATVSDSLDVLSYYFRQTGAGSASWGDWSGPPPTSVHKTRIGLRIGDYRSKVGTVRQGDGPVSGFVTLAPGATDTFVPSTSIYFDGDTRPIIDIRPANSAGRRGGKFRYEISNRNGDPSSFGFHLLTSRAIGKERFKWRVVCWANVHSAP